MTGVNLVFMQIVLALLVQVLSTSVALNIENYIRKMQKQCPDYSE